jgi:hypothetical protein
MSGHRALAMVPDSKECLGCGVDKPLAEYHRHRNGRYGLNSRCRTCSTKRVMAFHAANPENRYNEILKRQYGLSRKEYDALLLSQNGRCAICKRPPDWQKLKKRLHVDHDHVSGAIRGLLCGTCNSGLGAFGDGLLMLEAAVEYLKRVTK